jgi:hypothetical protein
MDRNNRIIYSDNGVLTDYSVELNDFRSGTSSFTFVAAEDAFYVGSELPFNNRFIEIGTANVNASVVSVELWNGSSWVAAVDVVDETSVSGKSLAQSGHISWSKSKEMLWSQEDTETITGLTTLKIFDLYWAKFKFSADLSASTIKYIGQKFSNDSVLAGFWPEISISSTKAQWPVQPKNDWNEQHYEASQIVIRDLRQKAVLISGNQILNWELFQEACAHRCAEIIMNSFGKDWIEMVEKAHDYYTAALDSVWTYQIDKNGNIRIDESERITDSRIVRK